MGWWPAGERSMMLRRVLPRTTPAMGAPTPASSGPRWRIASTMRRTGSSEMGLDATRPAIPHMGIRPLRTRRLAGLNALHIQLLHLGHWLVPRQFPADLGRPV